ncbi:hypothetical protein [Aeromonas sp. 600948]|uniref:hypothetical protein n=1 Tax=Aeromonas sp. 600948 TaxID=2712034 RepID=UPI003B9E9458
MQFDSSFSMNAIILITSDRPDDGGVTKRLDEDLRTITTAYELIYYHEAVSSREQFIQFMGNINFFVVSNNLKPVIHFHMHGGSELGLEIGNTREYISWSELTETLRQINISMLNELCVISTACYAFNMINEITITQPSPYFSLIASHNEVKYGYIDDFASKFYNALLKYGDLIIAHDEINDAFDFYHSEKMLTISLAKYILHNCKGKQKQMRKEELISKAISGGVIDTPDSLKEMRRVIKEYITPNQELLNRYVDSFLIGKKIPITIDDIVSLVEGSYRLRG